MTAKLIDGKAHARRLRDGFRSEITSLIASTGVTPTLAVVLIGDDAPSRLYVSNKAKACRDVGIQSIVLERDSTTSLEELIAIIDNLNNDASIHGILIQLPLPPVCDIFAPCSDIPHVLQVFGHIPFIVDRAVAISQCDEISDLHFIRRLRASISRSAHRILSGSAFTAKAASIS